MGTFSLPEDSSYPRTGSAPSGEHRVFRPTIPVMLDPNDLGDDLASARRQPLGHAWALLMTGRSPGPPIGPTGPSWQTVEARSGEPKMTRQSSHREGNATSKGARVARVLKMRSQVRAPGGIFWRASPLGNASDFGSGKMG